MRGSFEEALGWCIILGVVLATILLASCSPSTVLVKWKCPPLSDPPASIVDTLEATGRKDPSAAAWTVDLDKHYQKCDVINQQGKG